MEVVDVEEVVASMTGPARRSFQRGGDHRGAVRRQHRAVLWARKRHTEICAGGVAANGCMLSGREALGEPPMVPSSAAEIAAGGWGALQEERHAGVSVGKREGDK